LLGYKSNKDLYKTAFIHKSFSNTTHNEQLEFLGDAVLSSIVAEFLFLENPNKEEGFLSQKRAIIVSRRHLNIIGRKIIPETEIKSNLKNLPLSIFGNTLEAVIGAIYIDKGINQAKFFVRKNIYNSEFLVGLSDSDFKSELLKYSQKEQVEIKYQVEKQKGLDHQKEFLVAVFLNGEKKAEGIASSKKEAEQQAAKKVINSLF
jgi:ribonuclease-3